jgi:hypothetical protein
VRQTTDYICKTVWHDQVEDGSDALPDENAQARQCRNGAHVLTYNMKRVMRIPGVAGLMEALRA